MNGAQIVMAAFYGIGIGMSLVNHGKPRTGKVSVWDTLLGTAMSAVLLWWGGFWG